MISRAYIHEYGNGKLEPEHADVKTALESRGIACELFTTKRLRRNQLHLNEHTLVVGNHPIIETVLKKIGYNKLHDSYPLSLRAYLKRQIWKSSVRKIVAESRYKESSNIFIKPKQRAKLFTGFVVRSNENLYQLDSISGNTELYCSSVVEWLSEYRVFVNHSEIVGVKNYDGDTNVSLNMDEVRSAIKDLENSTENTCGYGIDFGVLKNGETALIEWNDGFALGSYGLEKAVYTDLILARWNEILGETFL